jgi:hypothetical protein
MHVLKMQDDCSARECAGPAGVQVFFSGSFWRAVKNLLTSAEAIDDVSS